MLYETLTGSSIRRDACCSQDSRFGLLALLFLNSPASILEDVRTGKMPHELAELEQMITDDLLPFLTFTLVFSFYV